MARCLNPYLLSVGIKKDKTLKFTSEDVRKCEITRKVDEDNKMQTYILAPCGKCFHCRQNRVRDWTIRTIHEYSSPDFQKTFMYFITFTYDNEHIEDNNLDYSHIQLFLKKLRKKYKDDKLKYLCVGEYGFQSGRKHFHMIIFGFKNKINYGYVNRLWQYGNLDIDIVKSYSAIAYMLKYSFKDYKIDRNKYLEENRNPPMFRCSQGFGKYFMEHNVEQVIKDGYIKHNRYKYRIPRYYREIYYRLFNVDGWLEFQENFKNVMQNILYELSQVFDTGIVEFEHNDIQFYLLYLKYLRPIWMSVNLKKYENHFRHFYEKV